MSRKLAFLAAAICWAALGALAAQEPAASVPAVAPAAHVVASPEAPAVETTVEGAPDSVEFGAPFELVVMRRWNGRATPPLWNPAALAPLVVVPGAVETQRNGDATVERRRITARAFVREEVNIPALGIRVKVKSALPEPPGAVEAPPGPFDLPFPWKRTLWIVGIALAALAAALAFARWWSQRPAQIPPPAPPVPPHERALARLAALRAMAVPDEPAVQRYYVEGSSIVRDYIEERFSVRAPEMTTQEFLNANETHAVLGAAHRAILASFLDHCDLVKFARQASTTDDRGRLCAAAERLVQETRIPIEAERNMTGAMGSPPAAGAAA